MSKQQYLFLLISLAAHTHLQAAQMNVETKEQDMKQLSAEEKAAAEEMFAIVSEKNVSNNAKQAKKLRPLLQKYPNIINQRDSKGETALMWAAREENTDIVKLLIATGAELNAKNIDGFTALTWSAFFQPIGPSQAIKILIAAGADLNAKDIRGYTALMWAVSNGNDEAVELLIAADADLNAKNNDGYTPLMLAAWNGKIRTIEPLIAAGANETLQNEKDCNNTALDYAIMLDAIIKGSKKDAYIAAVTRGKMKREQYLQAQQVAKKKITHIVFPGEIEEPEIIEIISEYAYHPQVLGDLPEETQLEKAQRITKEIQERKKQKAVSSTCRNKK